MPTAFALQRLLHGSSAPGSTTCTFDIFFKNHLTSRVYSCRIAAASTQVDKEVLKLEIPKIHEGEYRFCLILWKHEPVTAAQLAKLVRDFFYGFDGLVVVFHNLILRFL